MTSTNNSFPSIKRARAPSDSSSLSISPTQPHKASRIIPSSVISESSETSSVTVTNTPLLCTLPPTCHHHPTPIADTNELEKHYAKFHAHVCEYEKCGCVFTDARLLELHQTECHDPIAALRRERGEKIFQCHIAAPTCGRNFLTPKARRLHLIQAHAYPKEYFFAVTNKGIGGLLKKWGEGASMIRKEWKPREEKNPEKTGHREDKMDMDEDEDGEDEEDENENEEDEQEDNSADLEATPRMLPRTTGIHSPNSSVSSSKSNRHHHDVLTDSHAGLEALANSMESLSLVPDSVRFGRGGKNPGFGPMRPPYRGRPRGRGGRGGITPVNAQHMDVDLTQGQGNVVSVNESDIRGRGRGRGVLRPPRARGRGRGRGYLSVS